MHFEKCVKFILISLVSPSFSSMLQDEYFLRLNGIRIRNPDSLVFSFSKETQCCLRCLQYNKCQSVNFNSEERRCEINFLSLHSQGALTDANQSWVLFYRPVGEYDHIFKISSLKQQGPVFRKVVNFNQVLTLC